MPQAVLDRSCVSRAIREQKSDIRMRGWCRGAPVCLETPDRVRVWIRCPLAAALESRSWKSRWHPALHRYRGPSSEKCLGTYRISASSAAQCLGCGLRADPKRLIAEGYNRMGSHFDEWNAQLVDHLARRSADPALAFERDPNVGADEPSILLDKLIKKAEALWPKVRDWIHESVEAKRPTIIEGEGPSPRNVLDASENPDVR